MRVSSFAVVMLFMLAGCGRQSPASESAATISSSAVGPVPGALQPVSYRTDPLATDAVALQDGRRLFDWYNCSGCHGGHAGGGMGPSLRDRVWIYGDRDDQIYDSVAQGRANGMPAWGSKIPELQIWELVSYIKSLRTPQEPDPPVEPADEMVPNPDNDTVLGIGAQTSASEIEEHR